MKTTLHPLLLVFVFPGTLFLATGTLTGVLVAAGLILTGFIIQSRHKARQRAAYEAAYRAAKEKHDRAFIAAMKSLG